MGSFHTATCFDPKTGRRAFRAYTVIARERFYVQLKWLDVTFGRIKVVLWEFKTVLNIKNGA